MFGDHATTFGAWKKPFHCYRAFDVYQMWIGWTKSAKLSIIYVDSDWVADRFTTQSTGRRMNRIVF
jgi:hypothetical protein